MLQCPMCNLMRAPRPGWEITDYQFLFYLGPQALIWLFSFHVPSHPMLVVSGGDHWGVNLDTRAPERSLDINHPITPSHIRSRVTLNTQQSTPYLLVAAASQKASLCRNFVITSLLPSPGAWGRGQVSQVHYESSWPRGDILVNPILHWCYKTESQPKALLLLNWCC